jgi:hypothetical protein
MMRSVWLTRLAGLALAALIVLLPGQGAAQTVGGPCSPAPLTPPSLEKLGCPSGVWALMPVRPGAGTAPCASPIAGQIQRTGNYTIVSILLTLGLWFLHILYRDLRRDWRTILILDGLPLRAL